MLLLRYNFIYNGLMTHLYLSHVFFHIVYIWIKVIRKMSLFTKTSKASDFISVIFIFVEITRKL